MGFNGENGTVWFVNVRAKPQTVIMFQ